MQPFLKKKEKRKKIVHIRWINHRDSQTPRMTRGVRLRIFCESHQRVQREGESRGPKC